MPLSRRDAVDPPWKEPKDATDVDMDIDLDEERQRKPC